MTLRSVFFGTPDFAIPAFEACLANSQLVACVTQPDRPRGRGQKLSPCPVKEIAKKNGVLVFSPETLKTLPESDVFGELKSLKPDIFVVAAYGRILSQRFLDLPALGSVNLHASLLPRWRGAAPIQRCLEAGDSKTGVCIQKMVLELDAGDVLSSLEYQIAKEDNASTLSKVLSTMGGELVSNLLNEVSRLGVLPKGVRQNSDHVTFAPKIEKAESEWSKNWTAIQTVQKCRAFFVWPQVSVRTAANTFSSFKILECEKAHVDLTVPASTGTIFHFKGCFYLSCSVRPGEEQFNSVLLKKIKPENKGAMEAPEFFKSFQNILPLVVC